MKQTPIHFEHNPEILRLMPPGLARVVEVGCSSGALAKAYLAGNPGCRYTGIEVDPEFVSIAQGSCNDVICGNIEQFDTATFDTLFPSDCWVFGDVLEHLYDPWAVLKRVRRKLEPNAVVIACVPNAQHWSIQANLCAGAFRYQDSGLLDRTHIRWFTKATLIEMFDSAGFRIVEGLPRIRPGKTPDRLLAAIRVMAQAIGADPDNAVRDSVVYQWVVRATPA